MNDKISIETEILHSRIEIENVDSSVTPIFQNSAFESTSPYFYSRMANPNVAEFEKIVCKMENAKHCLAVNTGMTAIAMALSLVPHGGTLVVNKDVYGCSLKLFKRFADKHCVNLVVLDLSTKEGIDKIPSELSMIFFETPTNPFLKTISIGEVKAKAGNGLIVVDNTWATPMFQKPLNFGADVSLHSATKYFSGHSDVMGGVVLTNRDDLEKEMGEERFYNGLILAPHPAWLLRRSLQTFSIRLKEHERKTKEIKVFLEDFPQVKKIYYPEIDEKQLTGYGGILFFELSEKYKEKYDTFKKELSYFGTGTGMACVTSMVAQPYSGSHASLSEDEKREMNVSPSLVRICIGLEDIEDLKSDLANAFNKIK